MAYQNPISPALHSIPEQCPICHQQQVLGQDEIEDVFLEGVWTAAHSDCVTDEIRRATETAPLS